MHTRTKKQSFEIPKIRKHAQGQKNKNKTEISQAMRDWVVIHLKTCFVAVFVPVYVLRILKLGCKLQILSKT